MSSFQKDKIALFPLNKVLTATAGDYADSQGRELADYDMVGVHTPNTHPNNFLRNVPKGTEVVSDYLPSPYSQSGVALIPKPHNKS